MDYSKIADILTYVNDEAMALVDVEYLPSEFFIDFSEVLDFATSVSGGWATPTFDGEQALLMVWNFLCDMRELDANVMYDTPLDFFKAQTVDADIVPIEQGKKKKGRKKKNA